MVIKIVHVTTSLATAGAQMMLYKLLRGTNRQAFEPVVVSLTDRGAIGGRIEKIGVPVYAVGMRRGIPTPVASWRLIRTVQQSTPDLIQGWQYHGSLAAQVAQVFLPNRVPVLWNIRHSLHNLADEKRRTTAMIKLGAKVAHKAERVIYAAQTSAIHHEALGYPVDKRIVIPNGFDLQDFKPSEQARLAMRAELRLSPSTFIIGMIARYHPVKDHANFLQAAARLSHFHPEVHYLLAGPGVNDTNCALVECLQQLKLAPRTHLLGERIDMPCVTAALDIATSASSGEAFANAVGEAMACGVPCVVTDVGDAALLIGDTGILVPPKHPQALAEAWHALIVRGRGERAQLGQAARCRVAERFSIASVVDRYEQVYRQCAEKGAALDRQ